MNAVARTCLPFTLLAVALAGCDRPSLLPDLGLSRVSLAFEAPAGSGEPAPQSIFAMNTGSGSLAEPVVTIAYADGAGWLQAVVASQDAPYEIRVSTASAGLDPGVYRATLTVSSSNASSSPLQATVTLTVPYPRFALSAASLHFAAPRGGGSPAAQSIQVTNAGRGTLPIPQVEVTYIGAPGWLSVVLGGTPETYTLTAGADVTGLQSGTYTATLTMGASGAAGPPRTLAVTLTVPPAEAAVSLSDLVVIGPSWGIDPEPVSLTVMNTGGGVLARPAVSIEYEGSDPPWLSAEITGAGAPYALTLTAHQDPKTIRIASGLHRARVIVRSENAANGPQAVAVDFTVAAPRMWSGSSSVYFAVPAFCSLPDPQAVIVDNGGAGILPPPVATTDPPAEDWLEVSVVGAEAPYSVYFRLKAMPANLAGYTDVTLRAPGSENLRLSVTYYQPPPDFSMRTTVGPAALDLWGQWGAVEPGPGRVQVATVYGCIAVPSLSVSYGAGDPGWSSTSVATTSDVHGTISQTHDISLAASTETFAEGETRTATLRVSEPASSGGTDVAVRATAGKFGPAAAMAAPRADHALTALPGGAVMASGGRSTGGAVLASVELWYPETRAWLPAAPMTQARTSHAAAVLPDGSVLIAGGRDQNGNALRSMEICDPVVGYCWNFGNYPPRLSVARDNPVILPYPMSTVALVLGGGSDSAEYVSWTWGPIEATPIAGPGFDVDAGVRLADARVLATGPNGRAAIFDLSWTDTGRMVVARERPFLGLLPDGRVIAVGGRYGGTASTTAETWDPATGLWTLVPAQPLNAVVDPGQVVVLSGGKVLLWSGSGSVLPTRDLVLLDPTTGALSTLRQLPAPLLGARVVRTPSGMIFAAGGERNDGGGEILSEVYTW